MLICLKYIGNKAGQATREFHEWEAAKKSQAEVNQGL